jgi:hypothetical protein
MISGDRGVRGDGDDVRGDGDGDDVRGDGDGHDGHDGHDVRLQMLGCHQSS